MNLFSGLQTAAVRPWFVPRLADGWRCRTRCGLVQAAFYSAIEKEEFTIMKIIGVIPARYRSSRFPGKPLADICGRPMIW